MGFIITVGGIVLNIREVAIIAGYPVNTALLSLIGFILFTSFVGWTMYGYHTELAELEESKPSIEASLQSDFSDGIYITVKNNGEKGDFMAQIEILDATDYGLKVCWPRYSGYWEGNQTEAVAIILKGMTERIKLATFEQSAVLLTGSLRFYRMASDGMVYRDTHSYVIGVPDSKSGVVPEVCLKVTVSSHPSAKEGAKKFILRINGRGTVEEIPHQDLLKVH